VEQPQESEVAEVRPPLGQEYLDPKPERKGIKHPYLWVLLWSLLLLVVLWLVWVRYLKSVEPEKDLQQVISDIKSSESVRLPVNPTTKDVRDIILQSQDSSGEETSMDTRVVQPIKEEVTPETKNTVVDPSIRQKILFGQ